VPDHVSGHVIIIEYDAVAVGLVGRLRADGIPYVVVEPDPAKAARLVLANCEDTTDTNIAHRA
jgi:voltage-gated potassium channel